MFETNKIADVMTPKAIKIRRGHYLDTNYLTSRTYFLWVRHGKDFIAVDPTSNRCYQGGCGQFCKKIKLNINQRQTVPKLLALLNHGQS